MSGLTINLDSYMSLSVVFLLSQYLEAHYITLVYCTIIRLSLNACRECQICMLLMKCLSLSCLRLGNKIILKLLDYYKKKQNYHLP